MAKLFGLNRAEKLKSRKEIERLFAEGKSFSAFPLRVSYLSAPKAEGEAAVRLGVTVSRRNFKHAVDRNRIKRLLREVYRLQKHPLIQRLEEANKTLQVFIIYTGREMPDFYLLKEKVQKLLARLAEESLKTS